MNTDQARTILAAEDAHARALANLRNASAMSSDDPRATELLEEAGDAYAGSTLRLADVQGELLADARRDQLAALTEDPAASATEATIVHGAGASGAAETLASAPEPPVTPPAGRPEGGSTAAAPAEPQTPAEGAPAPPADTGAPEVEPSASPPA